MRLVTLTTALTLVSGLAQAGDWSGSHVDTDVGAVDPVSGPTLSSGEGSARYGVQGGPIIFGRQISDAEIGSGRFDLHQPTRGLQLGDVGRLNFQADRDIAPGLATAIADGSDEGAAQTLEIGVIYGLGRSTSVGTHLRLGGEALRQVFDDLAGKDQTPQSGNFSVRVSFRF